MTATRDGTIGVEAGGVAQGGLVLALRRGVLGLPSLPLAIWIFLFLGIPGILVIGYSFMTYTFYDVGMPWTLQNYLDLLNAKQYGKLFAKTFAVGIAVTIGALLLASPFSYYVARIAGRRLSVLLLLLSVLPLWMNVVIRNYSWIAVVTGNGVLHNILSALGLPTFDILYTFELVIVVGIFLAFPFAVLVLYATMVNISHEVEEASLDLGSSRFRTFRKVIVPLSASGYQTATLLIFMPTLAFFVTPAMLGGRAGAMYATVLMPIVKDVLDFAQGSAFIVPMVIFLMVLVYFFRRGINLDNLYKGGVGSQVARRNQKGNLGLLAYCVVLLFLTYVPLASMVGFSFDSNPAALFPLMGGTFHWYRQVFSTPSMLLALKASVQVALETALITVVLCAPAAYAVVRFRFPLRGSFLFISLLPMLIPEIILGMAILILLTTLGLNFGIHSIVLGHATMALPFVFLTILAQQYGYDRAIEEASRDLGATTAMTFYRVVLPLMVPGLVAGAFLAVTISFNDFVIAFMLSTGDNTLPMWIYGMGRSGTAPSINAVGTLIVGAVVLLLLVSFLRPWRIVIRGINRARLQFT